MGPSVVQLTLDYFSVKNRTLVWVLIRFQITMNKCRWPKKYHLHDRVRIRTRVDRIWTRKRVPFLKNCRAGPRCGRGRLASQGVATQPQVYVKIGSSGKQRHRTLENSVTPFIKILIFCNFVKYVRGNLIDGFWQQKDTWEYQKTKVRRP